MRQQIQREKTQDMKKKMCMIVFLIFYFVFITYSFVFKLESGMNIGNNFAFFSLDMLKLFPPAFVLVGLFMVWVERETIEKYFGDSSGIGGYLAAILLACTTLYPFIVVLPMAAALNKKGAKLSITLTYLGASAICRIPMTIFEASFIGIKFSIIRYIVSLPLVVISSMIIEKMVGKDYLKD